MDVKDYSYLGIMAVLLIGGIGYNVFDTGEEITCRTNQPFGWNVLEVYSDGVVKAECPYLTKEPVIAYCNGFRSTGSYERYACNEVILTEEKVIEKVTNKKECCDSTHCWVLSEEQPCEGI